MGSAFYSSKFSVSPRNTTSLGDIVYQGFYTQLMENADYIMVTTKQRSLHPLLKCS